MNLYFEISEELSCIYPARYLAIYDLPERTIVNYSLRWYVILLHSSRVWVQDLSGVRYLRNLLGNQHDSVDELELTLIILKCVTYKI